MAGEKLVDLGFTEEIVPEHYSVKEAVFPFARFPGIDILLGPEMKSTGEVMGIDPDLGMAYAKSQMAAGGTLPSEGNVFLSVKDRDKERAIQIGKDYHDLGFTIYSSAGTAKILNENGVPAKKLFKLAEGRRPNVLDMIKNGEVALIINTPSGQSPREDEVKIRSTAVANRIPVLTNLRAAEASILAIRSLQKSEMGVLTLQEYHSAP